MKPNFGLLAISMTLLVSSCSSAPKPVPIKIYSEPVVEDDVAKKTRKLSIRVMKEGYFDMNKDWQTEKVKQEFDERNMLFWNPSLIRHKTQ